MKNILNKTDEILNYLAGWVRFWPPVPPAPPVPVLRLPRRPGEKGWLQKKIIT